jgi:hypothetical protein
MPASEGTLASEGDSDAPPLPLRLPTEANRPAARKPARREENEEQRAARARIPTWDDIMLGVRRKSD